MISTNVRIGGSTTFWTIGEQTRRSALLAGYTAVGFEKYTPEPRPPSGALHDALRQCLGGPRVLIRPLDDKDGFTVVEEVRGTSRNSYTNTLTAKINPKTLQIEFTPFDDRATAIVGAFNTSLGMLKPAQVSASLVNILDFLGGTRLRPTGAIYWLPEHRLEQWRQVVAVVESAGVGRPNAVYLLHNLMDADAVRAVRDAIVADVSSEAERIHKEVIEGELGERALENRRTQAEDLRQRIALYEELLGVGLASLTEAVDRADQAAATAALLASAQAVGEVTHVA